jgi:hypothetical protein
MYNGTGVTGGATYAARSISSQETVQPYTGASIDGLWNTCPTHTGPYEGGNYAGVLARYTRAELRNGATGTIEGIALYKVNYGVRTYGPDNCQICEYSSP